MESLLSTYAPKIILIVWHGGNSVTVAILPRWMSGVQTCDRSKIRWGTLHVYTECRLQWMPTIFIQLVTTSMYVTSLYVLFPMYSISLKCAIGMCMECAIDDITTWPNRYIVFRGAVFFIRSHVYHLKEHAGMIISRYMVNTMSI